MQIIFLDIDGVLNTRQSNQYWSRRLEERERQYLWCPIACNNLQLLLDKNRDAMIVISSSWRISRNLDELKTIFTLNKLPANRILGVTPTGKGIDYTGAIGVGRRGNQIAEWLRDAGYALKIDIESFAIIDDDSDMEHLFPFLVKCDSDVGFSYPNYLFATDLLRAPKIEVMRQKLRGFPDIIVSDKVPQGEIHMVTQNERVVLKGQDIKVFQTNARLFNFWSSADQQQYRLVRNHLKEDDEKFY